MKSVNEINDIENKWIDMDERDTDFAIAEIFEILIDITERLDAQGHEADRIADERRRLAAEKAAREREEARAKAERLAKLRAKHDDIAKQAEEIKVVPESTEEAAATFAKEDGSTFALARAGTKDEHAEFLRSGTVPHDAIPVAVPNCAECRHTIERAAMIKALEWVRTENALNIPTQFAIAEAITRLKKGGDL